MHKALGGKVVVFHSASKKYGGGCDGEGGPITVTVEQLDPALPIVEESGALRVTTGTLQSIHNLQPEGITILPSSPLTPFFPISPSHPKFPQPTSPYKTQPHPAAPP